MDKERLYLDSEMEFPQDFRCPISMELMKEPVIITTGVTYERKNIEKWFFRYKKKTCPATNQIIDNFDITPNHTLKRLILAWQNSGSKYSSASSSPSSSNLTSFKSDEMASLLKTLESNPFKVNSLRNLRDIVEIGDEMKVDFIILGGLELLFGLVVQVLSDGSDFMVFRACEEALGVLRHLPMLQEGNGRVFELFMKPEFMRSLVIVLQRGSKEARVSSISILRKLSNSGYDWNVITTDHGSVDLFKSILELASDDISTKASSSALQLLIKILESLKKTRPKAIEAGAMCTLIELLPDSNKSRCEKTLHTIKLLCECEEGKKAFIEHGLAIGAISSKLFNVSEIASKICVKIFLLVCGYHPTEKVLEDMMNYGAVKKLVILMHMTRPSSTKNKMVDLFKRNSNSWSRYPCFPSEMKRYVGSR